MEHEKRLEELLNDRPMLDKALNDVAANWLATFLPHVEARIDRLNLYRRNARRSMRDMQRALERKNREIAELGNSVMYWTTAYAEERAKNVGAGSSVVGLLGTMRQWFSRIRRK